MHVTCAFWVCLSSDPRYYTQLWDRGAKTGERRQAILGGVLKSPLCRKSAPRPLANSDQHVKCVVTCAVDGKEREVEDRERESEDSVSREYDEDETRG
jgi:hypothetical protein